MRYNGDINPDAPSCDDWPVCCHCNEPLEGDGEPCITCKPCSECDALEGHAMGCSERELNANFGEDWS